MKAFLEKKKKEKVKIHRNPKRFIAILDARERKKEKGKKEKKRKRRRKEHEIKSACCKTCKILRVACR